VDEVPNGRCDIWPSRIITDYILTQFHISWIPAVT